MSTTAPTASKVPRRTPTAAWFAIFFSLVLVGVGVVGVHDLLVTQDWVAGSAWAPSVVGVLDGLEASTGLAVAGGALALVGLLVVLVSVRPGRRTHVPISSSHEAVAEGSDLWLTPGAVASLAHELADRSAGVISSDIAASSRRRVVVEVEHANDSGEVVDAVRTKVDAELSSMTPVRLVVRAKKTSKVTT